MTDLRERAAEAASMIRENFDPRRFSKDEVVNDMGADGEDVFEYMRTQRMVTKNSDKTYKLIEGSEDEDDEEDEFED